LACVGPDPGRTGSNAATGRVLLDESRWNRIRNKAAHHPDFSEIRAEVGSPEEAIRNPILRRARVLHTAIISLDRERLVRALADVRGSVVIAADRDGWHILSY
jgi:hypothetical protein